MAATRIDCDIHPAVGGTRTTLLPYLSDHWKEQVVSRAIDGLDITSYPPGMPLSGRSDWPPGRGTHGTPRRAPGRWQEAGLAPRDGAEGRLRPVGREPRDPQRALWRAG